jgi:hypothetical protein
VIFNCLIVRFPFSKKYAVLFYDIRFNSDRKIRLAAAIFLFSGLAGSSRARALPFIFACLTTTHVNYICKHGTGDSFVLLAS